MFVAWIQVVIFDKMPEHLSAPLSLIESIIGYDWTQTI